MSDHITLLGAEQVQSAGSRMASAADDMRIAANTFGDHIDRMVRALDEHAVRIEAAVQRHAELIEGAA